MPESSIRVEVKGNLARNFVLCRLFRLGRAAGITPLPFCARVLDNEGPQLPPLKSAALERARDMAPGWDVYALEADWCAYWAASGKPKLHSAEQAFLGFVKMKVAKGR